jgi:hypothetical protein
MSNSGTVGDTIKLYTIPEVTQMVNQTVQNYYNINSNTSVGLSLDYFSNEQDGVVQPVLMYTKTQTSYEVFVLTDTALGPFEMQPHDLQLFYLNLVSFTLEFSV